MIYNIRRDLKLAARALASTKLFTVTAVLMLALGLAVNTVVFTVESAVLLRNLPYPDANKLTVLHWRDGRHQIQTDLSAQAFSLVRQKSNSFDNVSVIYPLDMGVNISGAGSTQYSRALRVSGNFFQTIGVLPNRGRNFLAEEDRPGGPRSAIVSFAFWQQNLGGGSFTEHPVRINREPYTIIGVMPRGFRTFPDADVWMPLQLSTANTDPGSDYRVIARLKPSVSRHQAEQELAVLSRQYPLLYVPAHRDGSGELTIEDLHNFVVGRTRTSLHILFLSVVFVLLIACTNVGILLLVRAVVREHELAIRAALGCSKLRLIQISLAESALLAFLGGTTGIVLAKESLPFLIAMIPSNLPLKDGIQLNASVLLFTLSVSLLTVFGLGLLTAGRSSRVDLNQMLKQAPRQVSQSVGQNHTTQFLLSSQIALTVVLLASAGFLLKDLVDLRRTAPGFDPRNLLAADISLAAPEYARSIPSEQLIHKLVVQIGKVPGVNSVAAVNGLPFRKSLNLPILAADSPDKIEHACGYTIVSPAYFDAMKIYELVGRDFSENDTSSSTHVAIVNHTLAERWWPNENPIGHYIQTGRELGPQFYDQPRMVVGVVADVHDSGLERAPSPTVFVPFSQIPDQISAFANHSFLISIVARTQEGASITKQLQDVIAATDPDLSLARVQPLENVLYDSLASTRFYTRLVSGFAALALLLTAIGVFGLMGYQRRLRTREIAIRIAFGARPAEIFFLFLRHAMKMVGLGSLAGIIAAFPVIQVLSTVVDHASINTALVLLQAALPLALIAVFASLYTSLRAASTQSNLVLQAN